MAIPDYQKFMYPLIKLVSDGSEYRYQDIFAALADHFQLSDEDRDAMLPSGQRIYYSRIYWAKTYLHQAGVLDAPRRGVFRITERGRKLLKECPDGIGNENLLQFEEFRHFINRKIWKTEAPGIGSEDKQELQVLTPVEMIEEGYKQLTDSLAYEILQQTKSCRPEFFEQLVVDLLVKMGYGGTLKEAGSVVGKSGDGGIDGIIKEDRLGLDTIYVQAKRWENPVGRPEIQKFAGALLGQKARKGVFITTSGFTKDAWNYVEGIETKIVLIDGDGLADLMIEFGLGVSTQRIIEIKKKDLDYFGEE